MPKKNIDTIAKRRIKEGVIASKSNQIKSNYCELDPDKKSEIIIMSSAIYILSKSVSLTQHDPSNFVAGTIGSHRNLHCIFDKYLVSCDSIRW